MANKPNQTKRDIRAFERWLAEASGQWPDSVRVPALKALLALKTLDQADVPPVMVRVAADDMADFLAAHAAFIASHRTAAN